jgi:putative ABC transport system permease protein
MQEVRQRPSPEGAALEPRAGGIRLILQRASLPGRSIRVSSSAGASMIENFLRDVRIGVRVLLKERAFCALAVLVLALGICGVTAMFAVVNGVIIRGFSFPNASRLVHVDFIDPTTGSGISANRRMASMDFVELAAAERSFTMIAAYSGSETVNLTVDGEPRRYEASCATPDLFRILGVAPALGRDFQAADDRPGADKVVIISDGLWQRDFGGARDIVGRAVRLNGAAATIIGVMPKGFAFPYREDVWIPLRSQFPVLPRGDRRDRMDLALALIAPGVSLDAAGAEVTSLARRFADAYPATNKRYTAGLVVPLIRLFTPEALRGTLLTMLGFCAGVLLIACFNVMNMQFARAALRARELAVRSSLGATRGRLVRQMLTESAILATAGAAVGIPLAYVAADWLWATVHSMQYGPPTWMTFDVDGQVLALTVAATVAAAVVSGLVPAYVSSRADTVAVLRDQSRGSTSRGVALATGGLVVLQVVVTCVLLVGSLLQLRSIVKQQQVDFGYDTRGVLSARITLRDAQYETPDARRLFYDRLLVTLRNSADFSAAAITNRTRMVSSGEIRVEIEGKVYVEQRDRPVANWEKVSAGFAETIGQGVLQGRTIRDDDLDARLPIAVVNEAFARRHFGRDNPIGRRFRTVGDDEQPGPWRTIVGVARTVRMLGVYNSALVDGSGFYVPFYGTINGPVPPSPDPSGSATIVVRPKANVPAETTASALRRAVEKVDRDLPLYYVGTPAQHYDNALAQSRVIAGMFSLFGLVAVLMAAVGLYGVMSFSVNRRRQEFGVRMALGADHRAIAGIVLGRGGRQIAFGLTLGFILAFVLATVGRDVLAGMLFNVSAYDPFSYAVVFAVVTVVSLIAALVPALRAARVPPMTALRAE